MFDLNLGRQTKTSNKRKQKTIKQKIASHYAMNEKTFVFYIIISTTTSTTNNNNL